VLPPLEAEVLALERAYRWLFASDEDVSLEELLNKYDRLQPGDTLQRELIRPIRIETREETGSRPSSDLVPYVCRLLRSGITIDQFNEHFEAVRQIGIGDSMPSLAFSAATPVSKLIGTLRDPLLVGAWRKTLAGLATPKRGLWPFFENLFYTYGSRRTRFGVALLFDQFEEIFTRFVDPGTAGAVRPQNQPNWRLRWELINEVKAVYLGKTELAGELEASQAQAAGHLPLRFLVAMRDEYVAQMDPFREFVPDLDSNAYHLALLSLPQAESAIKEPAKRFNYTYSDDLYRSLILQLTKEERYVEPAHLQIVCEKLWLNAGQAISSEQAASGTAENQDGKIPQLGEDALEQVHGVRGILRSFFQEFLQEKKFDENARLEILEILEPLMTPNKTRNILEKQELVKARFRDAGRREELLSQLVDRTIVRIEPRLGGQFVEITHEFLIEPILEAISTHLAGNLDYTRFRAALRTLDMLVPRGTKSVSQKTLAPQDFEALNRYAGSVRWNDYSIELMLRSAIVLGADPKDVEDWLTRFSKSQWDEQTLFTANVADPKTEPPLSLEQLRTASELRDCIQAGDFSRLEWILRSAIRLSSEAERDDIAYWTERLAYANTQSH
jgi:hypothetical protein